MLTNSLTISMTAVLSSSIGKPHANEQRRQLLPVSNLCGLEAALVALSKIYLKKPLSASLIFRPLSSSSAPACWSWGSPQSYAGAASRLRRPFTELIVAPPLLVDSSAGPGAATGAADSGAAAAGVPQGLSGAALAPQLGVAGAGAGLGVPQGEST